jgi:hypothetical protein
MGPAIERAKRDAHEMVAGIHGLLPNARFALVVIRDFGSTGEEYEVLQPFTADAQLVEQAFSRVTARPNRTAENGLAESYNLLFRMSYTDTRLEWRSGAKKLVVVIGDAEPQSAGAVGLPGCRDTARDQHGLNTLRELANMRAAGRTLLMVRQVGRETSATLSCFESIVAKSAPGGAAVDEGSDLVAPIVELVQRALAPVTLRSDHRLARTGALVRFTVTLSNVSGDAARLDQLDLKLPSGFVYRRGSTIGAVNRNPVVKGGVLVWQQAGRKLEPGARLRFEVSARVAATLVGRYRARARAVVRTAYDERLASVSSIYWITLRSTRK